MRVRAWGVIVLLGVVLVAGACRKTITYPIYRRPVIHSVVAFPTVLGPGDSTMITIFASDPNGDPLEYDWDAYNGLRMKDGSTRVYGRRSSSMIFYRSPTWPYPTDTAFVWCSVRDGMGGMDNGHVLIVYKD